MAEYLLSVNFMALTLKGPFLADSAGYALSPAGLKRLLKGWVSGSNYKISHVGSNADMAKTLGQKSKTPLLLG